MGIVSEVKGLRGLNVRSEPLAKLSVVDLWLYPRILHLSQHFEQVEVELRASTRAAHKLSEILGCEKSIVVLIEVEECFPHRHPVTRKSLPEDFFDLFHLLCDLLVFRGGQDR